MRTIPCINCKKPMPVELWNEGRHCCDKCLFELRNRVFPSYKKDMKKRNRVVVTGSYPSNLNGEYIKSEFKTGQFLVTLCLGIILGFAWCSAQEANRESLCKEQGLYCTNKAK